MIYIWTTFCFGSVLHHACLAMKNEKSIHFISRVFMFEEPHRKGIACRVQYTAPLFLGSWQFTYDLEKWCFFAPIPSFFACIINLCTRKLAKILFVELAIEDCCCCFDVRGKNSLSKSTVHITHWDLIQSVVYIICTKVIYRGILYKK